MAVSVILEADNALEDWKEAEILHFQDGRAGDVLRAVYVSGGMASGLPAAMLAARDATGRVCVIEMSAQMLVTVARMFLARAEYEGTSIE